ncbi:MAG: serine/threonine protein kinase [Gammaproteobacteria bacterium]|nr:serine/threonine protein kinase [Gammaproteobacteria bacterium]MBU1645518.1 serine/threonine protein kinase [Gammaproteobacteria bacterium]MBU1973680.1 serine/threonine protein kinase [Gammaproteobacteria bacterium]
MASDNSQDDTVPIAPQGGGVDFDLDGGTRTVLQPLNSALRDPPATPTANHVALPSGYVLHEYTIEAVLGAGGFGITYLARDANLQCQVAIKEYLPNDLAIRATGQTVLPRTEAEHHEYRLGLDRFLAETRVLAGFRHHNIVRVNRFFEANQTAYMVMDYERGKPLRDWLASHGTVDEATLKRMFLPLLDGLEIVHRAGVVHRDIKPANIYVRDGDGSLVLLDFGAARQTTGVASKSLTSIITPGYAPFEQYHTRGAQGPWTDLYALAGVLYWLVTGQKPLEAPSRVKDDTMPPAMVAGAGRFGHAFLAAIDWALTVDDDARPRSVTEFRSVLMGEMPVPTSLDLGAAFVEATPRYKAGGLGLPGIAVAGAIAVSIGGLAYFALSGSSTPVPPIAEVAEPAVPSSKPQAPPRAVAQSREKAAAGGVAAGSPAAILLFDIIPPGEQAEVTIDGRKVGTAPPLREYKVAPGKHKIEIHGRKPPNVYYYWVNLEPNEKKKLWAKFANE